MQNSSRNTRGEDEFKGGMPSIRLDLPLKQLVEVVYEGFPKLQNAEDD